MAEQERQAAPPPALVLFDFDGVVVDSEVISLETLQAALAEIDLPLPLDEVRRIFLGKAASAIAAFIAASGRDPAGVTDRWHQTLYARFREALQPMPGVLALLDALDARAVPYCIASSGGLERLDIALTATGLKPRFEGRVFSAEQVKRGKPAPDLFLMAAARMGAEPSECLVIEDSPAGVEAATSAGMRSIGFVGGAHLTGIETAHGALLASKGAAATSLSHADTITALGLS